MLKAELCLRPNMDSFTHHRVRGPPNEPFFPPPKKKKRGKFLMTSAADHMLSLWPARNVFTGIRTDSPHIPPMKVLYLI